MAETMDLEIVSRPMSLAMPEMDVETAVERFQKLGQFVKTIMRPDTDYGIIPGTTKPTLLKPGAEKLCTFFGLTKEEVILDKEMDWTGKDHGGEPFFYFHYQIRLFRHGQLIAEADGSANSWESKHRYRQGEYKCPECGKETIRRSKEEKGGGYYCWSKLGGCGKQFPRGDRSIESQDVGKKKNPDPADLVNTIQKVAYKRALVAVTLVAVNASEYFTQDIEDLPDFAPGVSETAVPGNSPGSGDKTPPRSTQKPSGAKKELTLEEKREAIGKWLNKYGKAVIDAQNFLKKSYVEWDEGDMAAITKWGQSGFPLPVEPEDDIPM